MRIKENHTKQNQNLQVEKALRKPNKPTKTKKTYILNHEDQNQNKKREQKKTTQNKFKICKYEKAARKPNTNKTII